MEFHEAAEIFPLMGETELADLAEDIEKRGLEIPVEAFEGKILDGRNRFLACELKGIEPDVIDIDPDDPVAYVISMNLHRRQLTEAQRAMVAARVRDIYDDQAKERRKRRSDSVVDSSPQQTGRARDKAGEAVGVSGKSVDRARTVLTKGSKALVDAVDAGKVAVSKAATIAQLPKQEQTEALKGGPAAINAAVKKATGDPPKPKPAHPVSDQFVNWLTSISGLMTKTRQDYGSVKAMVEHRGWDNKRTKHAAALLRAVTDSITTFNKDMQKL